MNWTRSILGILKYIFITSFTALLLFEIIGLFIFDNRYFWEQRYLYYSEDPIVNELSGEKGFWKYKPNSTIRFAAVYADAVSADVEYDCIFNTNKFGFIDTGYEYGDVDYLVLGDSFTEGHGGCPWLTKSKIQNDDYLSKISLINGGLQGGGILTFEQILTYFKGQLDIDNLVIIAISNDFKRRDSFTWDIDSICYTKKMCNESNSWHYVPLNSSKSDLINNSLVRRSEKGNEFVNEVLEYSFTYRLFSEYRKILKNQYNDPAASFDENLLDGFQSNFEAMKRIKTIFPNVKIILVPQRDEVGLLGRKNADSLIVEEFLSSNYIDFEWCSIVGNDYMSKDGHPNKRGYEKMFQCLKNTIKKTIHDVSHS